MSSLIILITLIEPYNYVVLCEQIKNKCVIFINKIKEKLTPYALNIGYNILYSGSVCQIHFNKCYRFIKKMINPYIEEFKNTQEYYNQNNKMTLHTIKNGKLAMTTLIRNNEDLKFDITDEYLSRVFDNIEIFILNDIKQGNPTNKILFKECPKTIDYKESNINFITIVLEHKNETYSIVLKDDTYNYYIVNNSLNQNFFKYYLKNVHKARIDEANFDYIVTIIDHNVNIITLLPHQYIVFHENDYTIHPITETNKDIDVQSSNNDANKLNDFINLDVEVET